MNKVVKSIAAAATACVLTLVVGAEAHAVPLVGGGGLCANASALAGYVRANYPGVQSIGGVRPDRLPDHPSGHAIDIMVGGNSSLGSAIRNDIQSQTGNFGVKYILWQVPAHYDHVHVTVF